MEQTTTQQPGSESPTPVVDQTVQTQAPQEGVQTQQAPVALPEKYELKVTDQSLFEPAYLDQFQAYAKEHKLTQDQAQQILDREASAISEYAKRQQSEFSSVQTQWVESCKKDPEIGGDNFKASVELAQRALEKYATPSFVQDLNNSGYGNHPELVRIFARIGRAMSEDKLVSSGSVSSGSKSFEDIFYGSKPIT